MTLGEIERYIQAFDRRKKREAKERAIFDYKLADLIGKSVSRIYSKSAKYPDIEEVYSSLFDTEEIQENRQIQKDNLSAIRFRQFALSYNKRFTEGVSKE